MTSALLSLGCALIAFAPTLTVLFLFTYQKAQLIIVVTSSAFFYLLSSLASSILNLPFTFIPNIGKWNAFILIPISVICQSFFRCGFVKLYVKVENVILMSIASHDEEEEEQNERRSKRQRKGKRAKDDGEEEENENEHGYNNNNNNNNHDNEKISQSSLLRLELNDISCSIAAGAGFGGMHAVMLYGTLLASEGDRLGTLYQPSCAVMPSLVNSAIMAFWFSILDIVWMMLAFYGIRMWQHRVQYKLQQQQQQQLGEQSRNSQSPAAVSAYSHGAAVMYDWSFAKGRMSGKSALLFMVVTHLVASLTTTMNVIVPANGCLIALPLLAFVAIGILGVSWVLLKDNFLPEDQKQRIRRETNTHLD